jgi:ribosomal protein L29
VKLPQTMSEVKERLLAARQEIFVLTTALQVRDRSIAERDRQIAELRSQLMRLRQGKPNKFDLIESGTI